MSSQDINNPHSNTCQSVRRSFMEVLTGVKNKLDFESFPQDAAGHTQPFYEEICKIVTEVLFLNPANEIKVAGEVLPGLLVQEIFCQLTHEHIEMVADNFAGVTRLINNKKAYLRTALYNAVYEMDAHYTNKVTHDMAEGGK